MAKTYLLSMRGITALDDADPTITYIADINCMDKEYVERLFEICRPGLTIQIPLRIPAKAILIHEFAPYSLTEEVTLDKEEYLIVNLELLKEIQEEFRWLS